jgi:hypothetical protein
LAPSSTRTSAPAPPEVYAEITAALDREDELLLAGIRVHLLEYDEEQPQSFAYNPRQPRDRHGRWSHTGGGAGGGAGRSAGGGGSLGGGGMAGASDAMQDMVNSGKRDARLIARGQAQFSAHATRVAARHHEPAGRRALTDAEYTSREKMVHDITDRSLGSPFDSSIEHDFVRGKPRAYTRERSQQHDEIVNELFEEASARGVPREQKVLFMGGMGGSGKGTIQRKQGKSFGVEMQGGTPTSHIVIDPDEIKSRMIDRGMYPNIPGLTPMEAVGFIHEESSHIADRLRVQSLSAGMNTIIDGTMAKDTSVTKKLREIDEIAPGYRNNVSGVFVDVTVNTSVDSAKARHRAGHDAFRAGKNDQGGRYVQPAVIRTQAPQSGHKAYKSGDKSVNRSTFRDLTQSGVFTGGSRVYAREGDNVSLVENDGLETFQPVE